MLLAWHLFLCLLSDAIEGNVLESNAKKARAFDFFQGLTNLVQRLYLSGSTALPFSRLLDLSYKFATRYFPGQWNEEQRRWVEQYWRKTGLEKRKDLVDCAYLDRLLIGHTLTVDNQVYQTPCVVLTLDDPTQVECRLNTCSYLLEKLQSEVEGWTVGRMYDSYGLALRVVASQDSQRSTLECVRVVRHQPKEALLAG